MNLELPKEIESTMQTHVNRQLLKYAAGHVMFCPSCDQCLDCRSTVNVTVLHHGEIHSSTTLCASCYDKRKPVLDVALAKANPEQGISLDIVDGRALWPSRSKRPAKS